MQKTDLINLLSEVDGDEDIKCVTGNGDVLTITDVGYETGVGHAIRTSSPDNDEED